ncbi:MULTISPECIES: DUF3025 domain-containing protein [unclassified Pseudoalteromonas]|uniref:DUF3025 domain-containing protein n=1 Tax=unclassified Pseudoalteromonas TaxID=194690 RepID=UPI000CF71E89|nr:MULTISPECIES: DUF3025 domain-containing protein [unclassified Pseudoalteromonas]
MKRFTPFKHWQTACLQTGAFAHLNALFALDQYKDWPTLAELNRHTIVNANNQPLQFIDNAEFERDGRYYESFIFETGKVPTRQHNWHDLFGAYMWHLFPKTKALLNRLHIDEMAVQQGNQRSKMRNALTLFDECAVILAVTDSSWTEAFREHQWHEVFVSRREGWQSEIRAYTFGHANYEMLTQPFIGLTGKALFVPVSADIFCKDLASQYSYLDERLYEMIAKDRVLADNSAMSPLPLLGVPHWYEDNNNADFYANTDYFRPKRRKNNK